MDRISSLNCGDPLKIAAATILCLTVATLVIVFCQDAQNDYKIMKYQGPVVEDKTVPLIVMWTTFFGVPLKERLLHTNSNCRFHCDFINRADKGLYNRSVAAYVFHGRDMDVSDLPPPHSSSLNVLMLMESPYHTGNAIYKIPRNYFNATMSYRRDSRYFYPYGYFLKRTSNEKADDIITKEQLLAAVKKKTRGSLIFVSNCATPSKREVLIEELGKHTSITVRGKCNGIIRVKEETCISNCDDNGLIETHRFYISFENSFCNEYITEKFFLRISQMLVPIVANRTIYEDAGIPRESFIALDDFKSMEQVANHLKMLRTNDKEYLKYFKWTTRFRKPTAYTSNALCRLCEDIYQNNKFRIDNIVKYYTDGQCI